MASGSSHDDVPAEAVSCRDLAVARSLGSARTRAESRVQRFLDAALELTWDGDGKEFTVQEVADRSGQSLRSFYQYFGGKHEVLLALFEESIRATAEHLRKWVSEEDDATERLHRFVVEYYRLCRPAPTGKAARRRSSTPQVLVSFAQQLLTDHPTEAGLAFAPVLSLLEEILEAAAAAGAIQPGLNIRHVAGMVLQATMFNAFSATIAGVPVTADRTDAAEELWHLLFRGLRTVAAD